MCARRMLDCFCFIVVVTAVAPIAAAAVADVIGIVG